MICVGLRSNGNLKKINALSDGSCPSASYSVLSTTEAQLAYTPLTAADVLYAYTWGFGAVLMMWALGVAVGSAVGLIKKL